MTKVRLSMLVVLAVFAATAISASAASAFTEFTAAEKAAVSAKGESQELAAKESVGTTVITTKCAKVEGAGKIGETKKAVIQSAGEEAKYKECKTAGLAATVANTCLFTTHIGGTADLAGKNCATITVTATKCVITITGEQKGLKTVEYANTAGGFETKGTVGGVNFESATGKACGFKENAVKGTATYTGSAAVTGSKVA